MGFYTTRVARHPRVRASARDRPRASTSRARPDDDARTGNNFPRARPLRARATTRESRGIARNRVPSRLSTHPRPIRRETTRRHPSARARASERFERFSVSVDSVWKKTGRSNVGDDARAMGATRCALRASRAVSRGSAGTAAGRSSEKAGRGVVGGARGVMKTRSRDAGVVVRSIVSEREDEIEARSRREARESVVSGSSDDEPPEAGAKTSAAEKEYDIFRDSLLRYMGYANECGEAFVAWLPAWGVPATYGVAAT